MSIDTLKTKFQLRRDLEENWLRADPVLADGEPVLALVGETYKMKIGDGESHFSELAYYGGSGAGGDADWNTLLNKPFYERQVAEKVYTADFTGDANTEVTTPGPTMYCYLMEGVPAYTAKELQSIKYNFEIISDNTDSGPGAGVYSDASDLTIDASDPQLTSVLWNGMPLFISVYAPVNEETDEISVEFDAAGFYAITCSYQGSEWRGLAIKDPAHTELKQIDKKYIDYNWDNIENKPFGETTIPAQSYDLTDLSKYDDIVDANQYGTNLAYRDYTQEKYSKYLPELSSAMQEGLIFEYIENKNGTKTTRTFNLSNATLIFYDGSGNSTDLSNGNYAEVSYTDLDGDNIFNILVIYNTEGLTDNTISYQGKTVSVSQGFYVNEYQSLSQTSDILSPNMKICTLTKMYTSSSIPVNYTENPDATMSFSGTDISFYKISLTPLTATDFSNLKGYGVAEAQSSEGSSTEQIVDSVWEMIPIDQALPEGISDGVELWTTNHGLILLNATKNNASMSWSDNDTTQTLSVAEMGLYASRSQYIDGTDTIITTMDSLGFYITFALESYQSKSELNTNSNFSLSDALFYLVNVGVLNLTIDNFKEADFGIMSDLTDPTSKESQAESIDWTDTEALSQMFTNDLDILGKEVPIIIQVKTSNYNFSGITFTNPGVYLIYMIDTENYSASGSYLSLPARESIQKLDSKYLPDNIGGNSLPSNFPAEGSANANKIIGFDAQGNYTAQTASSGGSSEVSSWNDLTDKPFESVHVEQFNITKDLPSVTRTITFTNGSDTSTHDLTLYKISDEPYTEEDWGHLSTGEGNYAEIIPQIIAFVGDIKTEAGSQILMYPGYMELISIAQDNDIISASSSSLNITGIDDLEKGAYIGESLINSAEQDNKSLFIEEHDKIKYLDNKYIKSLPWNKIENVPFKTEIPESTSETTYTLDQFQYCGGDNPTINRAFSTYISDTSTYISYYRVRDALTIEQLKGLSITYKQKAYIDNSSELYQNSIYLNTSGVNPKLIIRSLPNSNDDQYGIYYKAAGMSTPLIVNIMKKPTNGYIYYTAPWSTEQSALTSSATNLEPGLYVAIQPMLEKYNYISNIKGYSYNPYYKKLTSDEVDFSAVNTELFNTTKITDNSNNTTPTLEEWTRNIAQNTIGTLRYNQGVSTESDSVMTLSGYIDSRVQSTYPGYITSTTRVGGTATSNPTLNEWITNKITTNQPYTFNVSSEIPTSGTPNTTITFIV